ncbi:MAG: DciA family protein [bacterium]|nr:DciA family protein [bacterium]
MSFFSLKDLVPKAAGKFQLQGELLAALVINRASALIKEVFDEDVEREIRVKKFTNGVLWCSVSNASVAQSMMMKAFLMRNRLNESLGEELVKNIRTFQEDSLPEEIHSG